MGDVPPLSPAQTGSGVPGLVLSHSMLHLHLHTAILCLRSPLISLINTSLMGFRTKSKPMMLFILRPSVVPSKALFQNVMVFTSPGSEAWGPAIQPTRILLLLLPHHRLPSAPVPLSAERIQFVQNHSSWQPQCCHSLSNACQDLVGFSTPTWLLHCDSEPQKQLCRDYDINVSVLSSATRAQRGKNQFHRNCKHLSSTIHRNLVAPSPAASTPSLKCERDCGHDRDL